MVDTAPATITAPDSSSGRTSDPAAPSRAADDGRPEGRRPLKPFAGGRRGGGGGGRPGRDPDPAAGRIDLRNTWQILAGSILVPLGVVFILMAWYGAAHTSYVQQQIPYLVSGSFAGVGCLILGGLLYWAHWLYRIYDQADLHHQEQLQALEQTLRAMSERMGAADTPAHGTAATGTPDAGAGAVAAAPDALAGRYPEDPPGARRPSAPAYVVTPTGSVFHLPSCPVVAHHPDGLRAVPPSQVSDLVPCRICLAETR